MNPIFVQVSGDVARYNSGDEDNFTQVGNFFRQTLNKEERERLVDNMASHLCNAQNFLQVHITSRYSGDPNSGIVQNSNGPQVSVIACLVFKP